MNAPTMKPWIQAITPYVPGRATGNDGRRIAKLSSNENPLGPSRHAIEAMKANAGSAHRYPDGASHDLREAIAARHGIEVERIVCGTGSDELLMLVASAFAGPGDEILFPAHAFMSYPIATRRVGATVVEAPVDAGYRADVDALLDGVTDRTRVLFLANPDNPKGTILMRDEVQRLHASLRGDIVLVLDSAYAEYVDEADYEDGVTLARDTPNVLMTRTFSKIYGLAAERIGWAYGAPPLIDALNRIRGPFNVTTVGQAGAIAALADQAWVTHSRQHNAKWRQWLADEVSSLGNAGLKAVPSFANFLVVTFPTEGPITAERAYTHLMQDGFSTRWLPGIGLAHALRISIGTEEEMRGLAASLRRFVAQDG